MDTRIGVSMDQPPVQHDAAGEILRSIGTWIMWLLSAICGATLASIRRAGTLKVAAYHILLASTIGPGLAVLAVSFWNISGHAGAAICFFAGIMIFGVAILIDRTNNKIKEVNLIPPSLTQPTEGIVTPEKPPTPPTIKESPK